MCFVGLLAGLVFVVVLLLCMLACLLEKPVVMFTTISTGDVTGKCIRVYVLQLFKFQAFEVLLHGCVNHQICAYCKLTDRW